MSEIDETIEMPLQDKELLSYDLEVHSEDPDVHIMCEKEILIQKKKAGRPKKFQNRKAQIEHGNEMQKVKRRFKKFDEMMNEFVDHDNMTIRTLFHDKMIDFIKNRYAIKSFIVFSK